MAFVSSSGIALWTVVKQSRAFQIILFILLPLLVILQFSSYDVTGIRSITVPFFQSTTTVKNAAYQRLIQGDSAAATGFQGDMSLYSLTVCAMVHNEIPYLIEWIEFHRLQGADHFVLYNYFSRDLVEYIPLLYESRNANVTIRVLPARFFGKNQESSDYSGTSTLAMVDCYIRYRSQSDWLLFTTAGHFTYSNKYDSIEEFLEKDGADATAIQIASVKFGTSGQQNIFRSWVSPDSYSGGVDLLYEPWGNSSDTYPLVLTTNTRRAPHRNLDDKFEDVEACKDSDKKRPVACSESSSVTLISGRRYCDRSNITECLSPRMNVLTPSMDALRADDHTWRSTSHVQRLIELGVATSSQSQVLDDTWYSRIPDGRKSEKYGAKVAEAVQALKPKIFLEVGRECDAGALQRGQQMLCPATHPFPYGIFGVRYLRNCCKFDRDWGNNTMTIQSGSCLNDSHIECNEPVGTTRWLHRSCCVYTEKDAQTHPIISVEKKTR
ncbi:uncharacterized protein LOC129596050 [Paramacrobiotus metropolitanus]|uniref:uncharacterized protein LOC129596050 n=1 Tax=Paramacrobiotus metropolitanus TaxID=2943436 RepID=UPI002445CCC5|nr:uncharacterized protein LOC129596050 [Paramacrobiotus metropolitanus]